MTNKIVMCIVGLMTILGLLLAGCGGPTPPAPGCPNITAGAGRPWLDEIVIQTTASQPAGIAELAANTTQLFATGIGDGTLLPGVQANANLTYNMTFGTYTDLTFNPIGPVHPIGNKLNPFANITVREAMNWMINREYICGTIMAGLGAPKYTFLSPFSADGGVRYTAQVANATAYYAHNKTKAKNQIWAAMAYFNTTGPTAGRLRDDGNATTPKWMYNNGTVDEWVRIVILARSEDERAAIGTYVGALMNELGFDYSITSGTGSALALIWQADPAANLWHIYTGGWASTVISRDEGGTVGQMFTDLYAGGPLWTAYGHAQPFFWAASKLWNNDFANMAEREGLFNVSITGSLLDSVRIFVAHRLAFNPWRREFGIMCDNAAGTQAGSLWAKTAHFKNPAAVWPYTPITGGTLKASMLNLLVQPWNPIAGSNWVFDMFPIRATATLGTQPDGRDGLRWPERIQKGDVIAKTGLPITSTLAWMNLTFVPGNSTDLSAPNGAWCDWNATTQRFITVGERTTVGNPDYVAGFNRTVLVKTVAYYPTSLFNEQLHDGSKISVADFMMFAILTFDRAKPASAIYDSTSVSTFNSFMATFRAVRFTTDNPSWGLIVETWTNTYALDAENSMNTWWPYYNQGPGFWHTIACAIKAEAAGTLAFGQTKSTNLGVEWTNFISGPSIARLKTQLASAIATNYLPYSPTMGLYVNSTQIAERYFNLNCFVTARNHFWVNDGPFYLYSLDTTAKIITLRRFVGWEDAASTWMFMMH